MFEMAQTSDVFANCGQIKCESLTESKAFEPEAFEESSENRVKTRSDLMNYGDYINLRLHA